MKKTPPFKDISYILLIIALTLVLNGCTSNTAAESQPQRVELTHFISVACPSGTTTYASDNGYIMTRHEKSEKIAVIADIYTIAGGKATLLDIPDVGKDIPTNGCVVTVKEESKKFTIEP